MSSIQPEKSTDTVHNNVINDEITASVKGPETTESDAPAEAENSPEETVSSSEDIEKAYALYIQKVSLNDSQSSSGSDSSSSGSSSSSSSSRHGILQHFLYFTFVVKP